MTPQEAIAYVENAGWSATRLGLDRTRELLERIGNPQRNLKFIHVAGSNGKGSTCAMLDAILRAAGYRVGLYTSPHIEEFGERIRINGQNIDGEELADLTEQIREAAEAMNDHPSQFELITAIGMKYFADKHCDIVVLEVGMGGTLDSTNAIDAPEAAVITNIGMEHTEYLGNSLKKIAEAKGGIIKNGCSCICYEGDPAIMAVIKKICREKNVPLFCADFSQMKSLRQDLTGQDVTWWGEPYHLRLIGAHQSRNAAVVLTTVEVLRKRGWKIPPESVQQGLATVMWPARLEVLWKAPRFILDGGHNPQCAEALVESIKELFPREKVTFLLGVLADKDYDAVLRLVMPLAERFVCVAPLSDRALSAEELRDYIVNHLPVEATACDSVEEGISQALNCAGEDGIVVAFGSLYMAGAVRTLFPMTLRRWIRKQGIAGRDALPETEWKILSARAVTHLVRWDVFQKAHTVLLYAHTRGELALDSLIARPEAAGKKFLWPRCINSKEMVALFPHGDDAWQGGYCGIQEPAWERSDVIPPEEIDLVICPCTAFDEKGNRMGMGGGFYDRFLPQCVNAYIMAVAFDCQKRAAVPICPWDRHMQAILTENGILECSENQYIVSDNVNR